MCLLKGGYETGFWPVWNSTAIQAQFGWKLAALAMLFNKGMYGRQMNTAWTVKKWPNVNLLTKDWPEESVCPHSNLHIILYLSHI